MRALLALVFFLSLAGCQHPALAPELDVSTPVYSELEFTTSYAAFELEALDSDGAVAYDINKHSWVVGRSGSRAVVWNPDREISALDPLEGNPWSRAVAINDRGMIAGTVGPTSNTPPATAVVWSTDGSVLRVLPRLPGAVQCQAMDISKHGDVVGFCSGAGSQQAVLWPFGGGVVSLPQLEGTDRSIAHGFNLLGDIVGRSTVVGVPWFHEPTLWTRERGKDYSVTRVFAYPEEEILYIAMNKFREVAGTFLLHYGFHWSNETGLTLQTGCSDSEVTDINDRGIMVGFCSEPPHLAFVWDGDGAHEYLPLPPEYHGLDPFDFSTGAFAINERGSIVGYRSYFGPGAEPGVRALLWAPQRRGKGTGG